MCAVLESKGSGCFKIRGDVYFPMLQQTPDNYRVRCDLWKMRGDLWILK